MGKTATLECKVLLKYLLSLAAVPEMTLLKSTKTSKWTLTYNVFFRCSAAMAASLLLNL